MYEKLPLTEEQLLRKQEALKHLKKMRCNGYNNVPIYHIANYIMVGGNLPQDSCKNSDYSI
jgi:hypothetical protein